MHLTEARCADLVLELLPPLERSAAVEHARTCGECEARLRAHVAAAGRSQADVAAHLAPIRLPIPARPSRRHSLTWIAAAAAALIAVVGLPQMFDRARPHPEVLLLPAPGDEALTRDGESPDPRFVAGLAAYRSGDLAQAERELRAAHAEGPTEQARRLYLAQALFTGHKTHDALELLRSIDYRSLPQPWERDAVTLLAAVLRASGYGGSADSLEHALHTTDPWIPVIP